ncbi:MAG: extracellular solute-binding protein [Candidatus Cloacimonadaceae bacterium]|nr:extracellular solute-binding protein [Candidatus Cloacimonadaceae bacterium]
MNYRIRALILLLILLIGGVLHAAGDKVILKIFELPDPRKTDAGTKANLAVIDAFLKKYPHIELRAYSGIKIENMDLDAGPLMAIAGGVAPDILYVNFRQSDTYIQNNFLYPLDDFIKQKHAEELELRVENPVWQVIRRKMKGEAEEKIWALPYETLVRVLMYRKDVFKRVGLDPERPPRTWDEYYDYARRLTIPSEGAYGTILSSGPQAAYDWIQFLWAAGGDAVRFDPQREEWYAAFADEAGIDAMEFYLRLATTKWRDSSGKPQRGFAIREGQWGYMWQEGKIGMRMDYLSQQNMGGNYDPNLFGFAPSPAGPSGRGGSEINCRMMGIFSEAGESNNSGVGKRDPVQVKQAAWDFIWFYDSEEARQIRMKIMVDSGYGKMQNPVFLKRYGYEEYLRYAPAGWLETFENALKYGKPEPYGNNCQKVYEFMTYPLEELVSLDLAGKLGSDPKTRRARIANVLKRGEQRTNEQMIGNLPPETRAFRNRFAMVAVGLIIFAFGFTLWRVWRLLAPVYSEKTKMQTHYKVWVVALLTPAVLTILMWKYVPMITGSLMAFQDYRIVGDSAWIGFGNFADVIFDPTWWASVGKTLYYMLLALGLGFIPPIALAILLQEVSRAKMIYRVIYYLPAVISGMIVIYLWKLLYDPSDAGGFNQLLMAMGLPKSMWIKDESLAMLCVVLPTIWAGMGPGCLIYLAALKNIPNELYEAAEIDGAGFRHKIMHIVLPRLKVLIIIQFIAAFIVAAQSSDFILVMTFGGPNEATRVADLLIFEKAYLYLKFGLATTMAWMLSLMLMGFTVLQIKYLSRVEFRTVKGDEKGE